MGHHEAGRAIFRNAISLLSPLCCEEGDGTDDVDLYPFVMRVDRPTEEVGWLVRWWWYLAAGARLEKGRQWRPADDGRTDGRAESRGALPQDDEIDKNEAKERESEGKLLLLAAAAELMASVAAMMALVGTINT